MTTIDGHTFDETKLNKGWIIDAGCRGFEFAKIEGNMYSLDIENFEKTPNLIFRHAALMAKSGFVDAHYFGNGTGNFVKGINEQPYNGPDRPCETKQVQAITLQDIYADIGTNIDLLKLDIEGAEYEILAELEPIPKQVTVEFHEHCHPDLHNKWIDKVLTHMCRYYHLSLHQVEPRYKFLDCLFIRKDL